MLETFAEKAVNWDSPEGLFEEIVTDLFQARFGPASGDLSVGELNTS